jgi:hypothetical protein
VPKICYLDPTLKFSSRPYPAFVIPTVVEGPLLSAGEVVAEVAPGGIGSFDQKDFFVAAPAFELLFAGDGIANVGEGLEINEFGRVVLRAEAGEEFLFVLRDAGFEVAGEAGVEDAGGTGHDIDVVNHGRDSWEIIYEKREKRREEG